MEQWRKDDEASAFLADTRWGLSEDSLKGAATVLQDNQVQWVWQLQDKLAGKDRDKPENRPFRLAISGLFTNDKSSVGKEDMILCLKSEIAEPQDPEDILATTRFLNQAGQKLDEDVSREGDFAPESIAVKAPKQMGRMDDIKVVLGPSGSGKTVFAINRLACEKNEKVVCVYYSLSDINPGNYKEKQGEPTPSPANHPFVLHVTNTLVEALKEGSRKKWQVEKDDEGNCKNKLKMKVSLILDEVGTMGDLLGEKPILSQIFSNIKSYATDARLILAGTGFDQISSGLSSSTDVHKYRMQPWDTARLTHAAQKRYPEDGAGEQYVKAIGEYPVLRSLITNARAAMFTLDAVMRLKRGYHTINLKGSIGAVVQLVIGEYIAHNGIGSLTEQQRKKMAYAVFHEIKLENESTGARFPEFERLEEGGEDTKIRRQAYGVLDIHVETANIDGNVVASFVDDKYQKRGESLSITPAMSMLLYTLMGVETTIYDTWEGLEATAALHAAYLEVLENPETETRGVRVARLAKPVPEVGATKNIFVPPKQDTPTIFINGDKAPFLDVIAIPRGLQAKYAKKRGAIDVYLGSELQKSGLLKEKLSEGFLPPEPVEEPAAPKESNSSLKRKRPDGDEHEDRHKRNKRAKRETNANKKATQATGGKALTGQQGKDKSKKQKEKSEKAFVMGNATMASFLHVWKPKTNTKPRRNIQLKSGEPGLVNPPFQSPAFYFPKGRRAEHEVVPSLKFEVNDDNSVCFQGSKIKEASFDPRKPFNMIFITNGSKFRLLPKQNDEEIVITPDSVDANGDLKDKSAAYDSYLKALKPKENVNIRFVFTGNEFDGENTM